MMTSIVLALVRFSVSLDSRVIGAANPHACLLDDPEGMSNRFIFQNRQRARQEPQHVLLVRLRRTENNDPRIFGRRVGAQISEIEIEREKRAALRSACVDHPLVRGAGEGLVVDCLAVMTRLPQECRGIDREVLIDLATHWYGAVPGGQAGRATTRSCASSAA